jgi:pyruvate/2-oxoglutarate dehydrogenase complex dihydrolipoamide acyltransferase (E2) component
MRFTLCLLGSPTRTFNSFYLIALLASRPQPIHPLQVAIMAVGSVQRLPRFAADGTTVVQASILNLSLGADHRWVEGCQGRSLRGTRASAGPPLA